MHPFCLLAMTKQETSYDSLTVDEVATRLLKQHRLYTKLKHVSIKYNDRQLAEPINTTKIVKTGLPGVHVTHM